MKHTKGEWTENPKLRGNVFCKKTDRLIASCMGYATNMDNGEHILENYANAKLIAQSPKMYQLCMKRFNEIEEELNNGMPISDHLLSEFKELLLLKKATE